MEDASSSKLPLLILKCICCQTYLEKPSDRNRVESRGGFNVLREIKDLPIVVLMRSEYICKQCLGLLKRRSGLKENLRKLDKDIENLYERTFLTLDKVSHEIPRSSHALHLYQTLKYPSQNSLANCWPETPFWNALLLLNLYRTVNFSAKLVNLCRTR